MAGKDKQAYKKESYIKKLKEAKEVYGERKNFLKEFALKKPKSDSGEGYWELKRLLPNQENQTIINQFLLSLKEKGQKEKSIVCKRIFLQNFFMNIDKSFSSIRLEEIDRELAEGLNIWKEDTIRLTRSALCSFYEFCWEKGIMDNPPLRNKRNDRLDPQKMYWEVQVHFSNEENKKAINGFLLNFKIRNRSKKTIEEYRIFLQRFFQNTKPHFSTIKNSDITQWFTKHKGELKEKIHKYYLGILRSFYNFCVREGLLKQTPILYKWEKERDAKKNGESNSVFTNQKNKELINEYLASQIQL